MSIRSWLRREPRVSTSCILDILRLVQNRRIAILIPCYNERENILLLYERVRRAAVQFTVGEVTLLFIDNCSTDGTVEVIRELATRDANVQLIVNRRNFGHVRSPFHGLLQATGDAAIVLPADLQVPPELVGELIQKWEAGNSVVLLQRTNAEETFFFRLMRRAYYRIIRRFADVELLENTPGWGLYDRKVIEGFRVLHDPYPYVRGLVSELGFDVATIPYKEANRTRGISKNNLYTLFDVAMLAMTTHSKVPLRLATMLGFTLAALFGLSGLAYLIYKLIFWDRFPVGMAPVVIGLFFFASVQLFFIGIIGEYIGAIYTKVTKRPLVVEKERINF